jgi:branched-chain amino acid aminotransferase
MHRLLLHNDKIRDTADHLLAAGQVGLLNGWGVFSTLRVIDGVLFAYPRHWARMMRDAALLHVPMPPSPEWLEDRLLRLVASNNANNATLRVAIVRNRGGMFEGPEIATDFDVIAFTKDLKDWGAEASLGLAPRTRHADTVFAGTKMLSWSFNLVLLEDAVTQGYDEVVLLNERGEVSECTSANLFAVFGNRVVTPPLSSGCLPGITRALLLEEIALPGIEILEQTLFPNDLDNADEVFMTSSTRDLLPVTRIEGLVLKPRKPGSVQTRLLEAFHRYLADYVKKATAVPLKK